MKKLKVYPNYLFNGDLIFLCLGMSQLFRNKPCHEKRFSDVSNAYEQLLVLFKAVFTSIVCVHGLQRLWQLCPDAQACLSL